MDWKSEEQIIVEAQDKLDPREHPSILMWKRYIWQLRKRAKVNGRGSDG